MHVQEYTQQVIAMQFHFHAGLGKSSTEARTASRLRHLPYRDYLTLHYVYMNYTPATLPLIYCAEVAGGVYSTNMLSGMRLIKQFLHVCLQGPAKM